MRVSRSDPSLPPASPPLYDAGDTATPDVWGGPERSIRVGWQPRGAAPLYACQAEYSPQRTQSSQRAWERADRIAAQGPPHSSRLVLFASRSAFSVSSMVKHSADGPHPPAMIYFRRARDALS